MTGAVLLVEDDRALRDALEQTLELADYEVTAVGSYVAAKDNITDDFSGVILSDIRMPGRDGFHLLNYAQRQDRDLPVILLTGEGDVPMAVRAMSEGAFDFLEKPCAPTALLAVINRAQEMRRLALENRSLRAKAITGDAAARMIFGTSQLSNELRDSVRRIAAIPADVFVRGEPGSGVSKIAEVLHLLSAGANKPFQRRAASGLSVQDLSALVGSENGGSFFLDEVTGLSPEAQFHLADLLDHAHPVRVIASSTQDLTAVSRDGMFSPDLLLKLDAVSVRIPPLRERPEDIPVMFHHFVAQACEQAAIAPPEITPELMARLMQREWPGNSRALMNAAMRFSLGLEDGSEAVSEGLVDRMASVERAILIEALERSKGQASVAAERLKLPRKTFYDKLARYGLRPESYR